MTNDVANPSVGVTTPLSEIIGAQVLVYFGRGVLLTIIIAANMLLTTLSAVCII